MTKFVALLAVALVIALATWLGDAADAPAAGSMSEKAVEVRVGDRIVVAGAPVACRVTRVRELGFRVAVDCRRGGPIAGTYGTLLTGREAAVVEFVNRGTARVLMVAKHDGEERRCT
jgi:hypothetical protein